VIAAGRPRKDAAGAILYAAEKATWMAGEAIQALGGNGYINEYPTGRLWRDASSMKSAQERRRCAGCSSGASSSTKRSDDGLAAQACLREVCGAVAGGLRGRAHLQLRVHVLRGMRGGDGRPLPQLQWRTGAAAAAENRYAMTKGTCDAE
jgi:hypothetical protein